MSYHYLTRQEVDYRLTEITKAAHNRNLVLLAEGAQRRKPSQRILRVVGWALINLGERLYQQAERQEMPVQLPADAPC